MKTEITKNVEYYLGLPYGIVLRKDDEGDWVARIEELPGCTAHGKTREEALESLQEVQQAWIEDALAVGDAVPEPQPGEGLPSGKWLQRTPKSLHRKLVELAKREGVSLNQLATSILAEAVGRRHQAVPALTGRHAAERLWHYWQTQEVDLLKVHWNVDKKPLVSGTSLLDALSANVSALPNEIFETNFKVIERARKKEQTFKA